MNPERDRIVMVFNASAAQQVVPVADATGSALSAVQAAGSDAVVKQSTVGADAVTVPARTVAVFGGRSHLLRPERRRAGPVPRGVPAR